MGITESSGIFTSTVSRFVSSPSEVSDSLIRLYAILIVFSSKNWSSRVSVFGGLVVLTLLIRRNKSIIKENEEE